MKKLILFTFLFLLTACTNSYEPLSLESNEDPCDLPLHIFNQSPAVDPVDIEIELDNVAVLNESFNYDPHGWTSYCLPTGNESHTFHVSSDNGQAKLSQEYLYEEGKVLVLNYWFYPDDHSYASPHHFELNLINEEDFFVD